MGHQRWIAVLDVNGKLGNEPEPYSGPDDSGCQVFETTDGTYYRGIASTKDQAIGEAPRCWENAQD